MFELAGRTLSYQGRAVLSNVDLRIGAGEHVALLGRSGAGKSTLLAALHEAAPQPAALIPQDVALVDTLSVFHNVYMGRLHQRGSLYNLRNLVWPARKEIVAVDSLLDPLGLAGLGSRRVAQLSGGQRQRVAVARALHQAREVVLGDEPVSAVDQTQARAVIELIQTRHATTVMAMHDVELALAYADRIVGLRDGRIWLDAPAAELTPGDLAAIYDGTPQSAASADCSGTRSSESMRRPESFSC